MHRLNPALYNKPQSRTDSGRIRLLLIGCGGTGSAVAGKLHYLDAALRAQGHPGIDITLMDGDAVSMPNTARSAFSPFECGLNKAIVIADRQNRFRGTRWRAIPRHFRPADSLKDVDILISCVDKREVRGWIHEACTRSDSTVLYWCDIGNGTDDGQWVLGEPLNPKNRAREDRLPTVAELYPEITIAQETDDETPSCSAAEALTRQEPLINDLLADGAMMLLARLLRHGQVLYHGQFAAMERGQINPIPADPNVWANMIAARLPVAIA